MTKETIRRSMAALLGCVLASGGAWAAAEDDLATVKRAVARSSVQATPAPAATPTAKETPPPARTPGKDPQWLKVRVVDKGTKRGRVSVNLPLALVRALGDDWPLDLHCGRYRGRSEKCRIKIGEVLQTLHSGQDLVEIDDDDSTVRIWVE